MKKVVVLGTFINALGVVRALARMKEYYIIVIGKNGTKNIVRWSKYPNEMVYIPEGLDELNILLNNREDWKGAFVIPTSDDGVRMLQEKWDSLEQFYNIIIDKDACGTILDKERFISVAKAASIPSPRVYDKDEKIDFPVIIKPKGDHAKDAFKEAVGRGILIVNNQSQWDSLKPGCLDISIIQEYIPGEELFFCGGYCHQGQVQKIFAAKKIIQRPPFGGDTVVARSVKNDCLIDYTRKLLKELCYTGIFDIEFKYSKKKQEFCIIEMNPRSAKWISFPELMGLGVIKQALNPETDFISDYEDGKVWIDIYGLLANLFQYPSCWRSVFKYLYYLATANYFAVFDRKDMKPFLKRR